MATETPTNIEAALVSFGNYLFERYGVQVYSNDGKNEPLYQRLVHDADLRNWEQATGMVATGTGKLPSRYNIGDEVSVCFANSGKVQNCEVIKVHFTESKVMYDVVVKMEISSDKYQTRLYNIDSAFVEAA